MIIFIDWIFKLSGLRQRDGITLWPFICIRETIKSDNVPLYQAKLITHERVHWWQNAICIVVGMWLISILYIIGTINSRLWVIAPFMLFYVIYGAMFLYEFARYRFSAKNFETEYRAIWFERKARKRAGI